MTARWRTSSTNGSALGCQIIVDDGTSRLIATSTGTALTVEENPDTPPVIFNQDVKIGPSGAVMAASCVFRESAQLPSAQISNLSVFLGGQSEVNLVGPTPIGNVAWSKKGPDVPSGRSTSARRTPSRARRTRRA